MKKLIVICGATASGKTALAVECAKHFDGEVISCDALLVYRGLNIGTAKPTAEEMAGIPHHLINVADPREKFSVHDFETLALPIVEEILARGKTPVLCGGTGFYMNALLFRSGFGHVAFYSIQSIHKSALLFSCTSPFSGACAYYIPSQRNCQTYVHIFLGKIKKISELSTIRRRSGARS